MIEPTLPEHEAERLAALAKYQIVDTEPEQVFDDFTQLAADICGTPIALISLIDATRQWFKSKVGVEVSSTPRNISFCGHAIHQNALFEISNAIEDTRFASNPLVTDNPHIRFYAGMPLTTESGYNLGTLCVIDTLPRNLTNRQRDALQRLARQVILQIEHRSNLKKIHDLNHLLDEKMHFIKRVTDEVPVLISYWDSNLRCQFANAPYQEMYGFDAQLLIGKTLKEIAAPETWPFVYPHALLALSGQAQRFDLSATVADGSLRHGNVNYTPDIRDDGSVAGYYSVVADVTAFKNIQKEHKLAAAVLDNISEAIIITDANHHIISTNPAFTRMTGYTLEEVVGKSKQFLLSSTDTSTYKHWTEQLNRERFWMGEIQTQRKDGLHYDVRMRVDCMLDQYGNVTHHIASMVDCSKELIAELELASITHMLERTGEMAKVGGWELDIATKKIKRSAQVLKILEIESGPHWTLDQSLELFPDGVKQQMQQTIQQCIDDGTPWDVEVPIHTANGRAIWIHSYGERISSDVIGPIKLAGAIQDITERKNAEVYRLAQETTHKNALVREVHHRIKNNLQGITNLLFNFGTKYPELAEVLAAASSQIQSVAIIHGLQGHHSQAKVEIKHLLTSIVKNAESLWQTKMDENISAHTAPVYLTEIESVPIALVINELIANAIKHSTQQDSITVHFSYDEQQTEAQILITNQGALSDQTQHPMLPIHGAGLKLISALMPKSGAQFTLKQEGNQVLAKLIIAKPIIEL